MRKSVLFALIICAAFLLSCGKGKNDEANKSDASSGKAKIIFAVGDVTVENARGVVAARVNMPLEKGFSVITGPKAQCNLLIGEDSYISIREKSRMQIDMLKKNADGLESNSVDLKVGRLVVNPKKLLKDEEFKVKTPTAVAAVRGTKFVVAQEEGVAARVAVVEGKVEMKPRVEAVETPSTDAKEIAIVSEIQKRIDDKAIIIEANQSASIDAKSSEALNKNVESVIKEMKEKIPDPTQDGAQKSDIAKTPILPGAAMDKLVKRIEITREAKIDKKVVEEVKDFDQKVKEDKKHEEESNGKEASLTITTPIKYSMISVNGKRVGQGSVSLKVQSGTPVKIEITTKDFDKYEEELTLSKNESKTLDVALVRAKLRDRVGWSGAVGSGVKGDVVFFNDLVIVSTASGAIVAMTKEGDTVWRAQLTGGLDSAPAVADAMLYAVTKQETLYAVNAVTGRTLWSVKVGGTIVFGAAPRVIEKNIVIATSSGKIYSFTPEGKEQWMTNIQSGIYSTPSFGDGKIFIGAEDQQLYALSLKDGKVAWKESLDARVVSSSPVVMGDKVIVGTYKGSLYAVSIKKGKQIWTMKTGGAIVSSPVVRKDLIYIGSRDGNLYALSSDNGSVKW
ncbi:MAG TPA: PQQ-binding-like beta-propeller repeat protein, partial [Spirochaetota bacterium]